MLADDATLLEHLILAEAHLEVADQDVDAALDVEPVIAHTF